VGLEGAGAEIGEEFSAKSSQNFSLVTGEKEVILEHALMSTGGTWKKQLAHFVPVAAQGHKAQYVP